MTHPSRASRLAIVLAGLVLAGLVGAAAYNFGFSQGIAQQLPAGTPVVAYPWPYRPWGFGFGFLIPLLFGFLILRALFWGFGWRRHWHGAGAYYGRGCHPGAGGGVPPAFDEWHRRAHERERQPSPPQTA